MLFRLEENGVWFSLHAGDVLPLGAQEVAVRDGLKAAVYRFDERAGWAHTGNDLEQYLRVGEQTYAVVL